MSLLHPFSVMIIGQGLGNILFTPCPGTKDVDLTLSLTQLVEGGAAAVLTLMPLREIQENGVAAIPQLCAELGIAWFHFPIEDDHAPGEEFTSLWQAQKMDVHNLLAAGKSIAIHCKGGTGRTGVVAAQILLERGIPLEEVILRVRAIRPKALNIPAHMAYIQQLAQEFNTQKLSP